MDYMGLREFLSFPQLPDVISYLLFLGVVIVIEFLKAFVKRDNQNTILKVGEKTKALDKIKSEYEKEKKELEKERKKLAKELKIIKDAIKQSSSNVSELVSNGIASKVNKMLDSESQNIEE